MVEDEPVVSSSKWFHFLADGGLWYTSCRERECEETHSDGLRHERQSMQASAQARRQKMKRKQRPRQMSCATDPLRGVMCLLYTICHKNPQDVFQ